MQIIYAHEPMPQEMAKAVFLAGPTPRKESVKSWRPDAIKILGELGYDGVVFVPEPREGKWNGNYENQIDWEVQALNMADCIIFWVPRKIRTLPAFTTNIEYGEWMKSGKIVLGAPKDAEHMNYLRYRGEKYHVQNCETLEGTVELALAMVGDGAIRRDGECHIPLHIWNTESFQSWYNMQRCVGNRINSASVMWNTPIAGTNRSPFFWILHVDVYIAAERRNKCNEVIIARPNISSVLLYKKGKTILDTTIVLVREFRSPVANINQYVWELPGGSTFGPEENPHVTAAKEVHEETGLHIDSSRIHKCEVRQLASTALTHRCHLFCAEITDEEISWLTQQSGIAHGVEEDTERTYVELRKVHEILSDLLVDWSMCGMILSVLASKFS